MRAITPGVYPTSPTELRNEATVYKPYGERVPTVTALQPESKGRTRERFDPETGLQYLNARYYDPEMGMFLQPDWWEVTNPGVGTNRYAYSAGDPINMADRNGNKPSKADAKAMADDVYHKDGSKAAGRGLPEHISRMTAAERDKRFPGAVWSDERTGFLAGAYRNSRTGELSIAYAGTDPNSPADIATNVAHAATGDSMQHKQARELAKVASQASRNSPNSLSFVGHSLGGGLALEAALLHKSHEGFIS